MGRIVVTLTCCGKKTEENKDPVLKLTIDGRRNVFHDGCKYSFKCRECYILSDESSKNRRDYFSTAVHISGGWKTVLIIAKGKGSVLKVVESKIGWFLCVKVPKEFLSVPF